MTDRLNKIFSLIPNCKVFADVGCDHGYLSKAVLDGKKAQKVYFSDLSKNCLDKAKRLLFDYEQKGEAIGVVSNGFENLEGDIDCALVAGMGGEEILLILKNAKTLPNTLILQPMKNAEKVRRFLNAVGYVLSTDVTFKADGKFYDIICASKGKESLTEDEAFFGKDNLSQMPIAFIERWKNRKNDILGFLSNKGLSEINKKALLSELERINRYVKD